MTDDGSWVGTAAAAALLGVSERTIRRRAMSGELPARRVAVSNGQGWAVWVSTAGGSGHHGHADAAGTAAGADAHGQAENVQPAPQSDGLVEALALLRDHQQHAAALVERLTRENRDLAGQVGFLQARLLMLDAPRADAGGNGSRTHQEPRPDGAAVETAPQPSA